MATIINHIGRGAGAGTLDKLFSVLAAYPLDRTFERYGNFVELEPETLDGKPLCGVEGGTHISGNFFGYSCGFSVVTDDPELIERLSSAIQANRRRPDYLAQPEPELDPA